MTLAPLSRFRSDTGQGYFAENKAKFKFHENGKRLQRYSMSIRFRV